MMGMRQTRKLTVTVQLELQQLERLQAVARREGGPGDRQREHQPFDDCEDHRKRSRERRFLTAASSPRRSMEPTFWLIRVRAPLRAASSGPVSGVA